MSKSLPPVSFYVPADVWPSDISEETGYFWSAERIGKYNWTIQTCHHLQASGFPCEMVKQIPDEGIILAHRGAMPDDLRPGKGQLFVCIQADRPPHPFAQFHLLQNEEGTLLARRTLKNRIDRMLVPFPAQYFFIRYWPQPELMPREAEDENRFKRIVYMGRAKNLAPELRTSQWHEKMASLGFEWEVIEQRDRWKDYRDVDVIVAVRSFDEDTHTHKPATKLYNAWHAGVPAILGRDSAFTAERTSDLDYIAVYSPDDIIDALLKLREDGALRKAMIENGFERAKETRTGTLVEVWKHFLVDVAGPAYQTWCRQSPLQRNAFLAARQMHHQTERFVTRVGKFGMKARRVTRTKLSQAFR